MNRDKKEAGWWVERWKDHEAAGNKPAVYDPAFGSLADLAWISGTISNLAGWWNMSRGHVKRPSLSISPLKYAGQGSVGGSHCHCLCSHSSSSQQKERKHSAKRISPNPCWFFFFFCGLKRDQIRAKCPSQQLNEHYAISPWLSGVSGFLFPWKSSCSEMKSKWYGVLQ